MFIRVHRIGKGGANTDQLHPVVTKFDSFKDRETVRRSSRILKDAHYGISE